MAEHKEFDIDLFLSICADYGLNKEDIFKDINEVKATTNMDILKTMFSDIQWDNECNGIIYGFKTDDRSLPILGVDLDWGNEQYKKLTKTLSDADQGGLAFADMPTAQ